MIPAKRNLDSSPESSPPRANKRDSGVVLSPLSSPSTATPKLAPRSKSLYKTGPAFVNSQQAVALCSSDGTPVTVRLHARLDRGFEEENGNWICYRRNYMSLCAAFDIVEHTIVPMTPMYPSGPVYIASGPHEHAHCLYFVQRVEARVVSTNTAATLMQHTAKRDPGSQTFPSDIVLYPGKLPPHEFIRDYANVRCPKKLNTIFNKCNLTLAQQGNLSPPQRQFLETYPDAGEEAIAKVARFERLQFQFIHRSRREGCKYRLQVSLLAMISHNEVHDLVEIATCHTPEIVVRGRSPASYSELGPSNKVCRNVLKEPGHAGYGSPENSGPVTTLDYYGLEALSEFDVTDNLDGEHKFGEFKCESPSPTVDPRPPRFSLPDLSQSISESESDLTSDEETQVAQLLNLPPPKLSSNDEHVEVKAEPEQLEEFAPQLTFDTTGFALGAGSEVSFDI
ncbi:Meiosis-specific transcription factor NDT80 [Yarrowia sp. B02]|nr:Meiosis-specific transcription factor NDT80 [Yarrowia sp. B02]